MAYQLFIFTDTHVSGFVEGVRLGDVLQFAELGRLILTTCWVRDSPHVFHSEVHERGQTEAMWRRLFLWGQKKCRKANRNIQFLLRLSLVDEPLLGRNFSPPDGRRREQAETCIARAEMI